MRGRTTGAARLGIAAAGLAVALAAPRANAQAVIKVNDDVNFKFGFLLQPQADWTENAANGSTSQNLFVRRARVLVGGQLAKNLTFFFETPKFKTALVCSPDGTISRLKEAGQ